jgi:pimeloyl-ACP methyl ester carboxylesterase
MASVIQKTVQNGKMKVNNVELYYEVHGEGDAIIFIQGTAVNLNIWNSQIDFFSDKHKVIAYDVRGQGKSDKPLGEYSIQIFANDLYALMRGLKLEKATIVGHSNAGLLPPCSP